MLLYHQLVVVCTAHASLHRGCGPRGGRVPRVVAEPSHRGGARGDGGDDGRDARAGGEDGVADETNKPGAEGGEAGHARVEEYACV